MSQKTTASRRGFLASSGAAALTALAGCTGGTGLGGMTNQVQTVTMATTQTGSLGVLTSIVQEEGFAEEHGIELDIQGAAPGKAMQLLKNEAVVVSIFSPQGASIANTEGSNIRLFGPNLSNHTSLMTATDDGDDIQGWDDLVGESVGILGPPTGMWNHTQLLLAEMGHSMDDFDFRKGSPGAIHAFDTKGDVAAHAHFVPVTIKAIQSGAMREVLFMPDAFEEIFGHNLQFVPLAAHEEWIEEDPDRARSVRAAMIDAQTLFTESPEETISNYMDVIGLENDEQVSLAVERMPAIYPAEWTSDQKDNVVSQLERSKENGILPPDAPTDIVADL